MTETGFIEYEAYEQRGVELAAALAERHQFLARLTALRTAVKKLERGDLDLAVAEVKDRPEKELVLGLAHRVASRGRLAQRLEDLLFHYMEEAGVDTDNFDPWDDHGI